MEGHGLASDRLGSEFWLSVSASPVWVHRNPIFPGLFGSLNEPKSLCLACSECDCVIPVEQRDGGAWKEKMLCQFSRPTRTNDRKLGGLKQQTCLLSQSRRPDARNGGTHRAASPPEAPAEAPSFPSRLRGGPGRSGPVCVTLVLPPLSPYKVPLCVAGKDSHWI